MQDEKINLPAEIGMSELGSLIASEKENLFLRPFSREIELMKTEVAGCRYRENIKESLKALKEGDHMTLVREPLNPYDGRAIMVMGPDESFLGYIPRRKNEVLAASCGICDSRAAAAAGFIRSYMHISMIINTTLERSD